MVPAIKKKDVLLHVRDKSSGTFVPVPSVLTDNESVLCDLLHDLSILAMKKPVLSTTSMLRC